MQPNTSVLAKKAIDSALKSDWQEAINLNKQILEKESKNIDAKLRLGRAYMQVKDFKNATKLFQDVLLSDPINQIAKKNLELAKAKKADQTGSTVDAKSLIKEPGTSTEVNIPIAKYINETDMTAGEVLYLKVKKRTIDVIKKNDKEHLTGTINDPYIVKRVNIAVEKKSQMSASFVKINNGKMTILIKCEIPVFKSDRQDIKPYIKKGSIDEPELEIELISNTE